MGGKLKEKLLVNLSVEDGEDEIYLYPILYKDIIVTVETCKKYDKSVKGDHPHKCFVFEKFEENPSLELAGIG